MLTALCTGMVGYSAYAPSKFAVRGLAECLRNEVGCDTVAVGPAAPQNQQQCGILSACRLLSSTAAY
jgi:NAD(P)-dependent dehydrogenase (short-subunit alcohol dehydrogenase family)